MCAGVARARSPVYGGRPTSPTPTPRQRAVARHRRRTRRQQSGDRRQRRGVRATCRPRSLRSATIRDRSQPRDAVDGIQRRRVTDQRDARRRDRCASDCARTRTAFFAAQISGIPRLRAPFPVSPSHTSTPRPTLRAGIAESRPSASLTAVPPRIVHVDDATRGRSLRPSAKLAMLMPCRPRSRAQPRRSRRADRCSSSASCLQAAPRPVTPLSSTRRGSPWATVPSTHRSPSSV